MTDELMTDDRGQITDELRTVIDVTKNFSNDRLAGRSK